MRGLISSTHFLLFLVVVFPEYFLFDHLDRAQHCCVAYRRVLFVADGFFPSAYGLGGPGPSHSSKSRASICRNGVRAIAKLR